MKIKVDKKNSFFRLLFKQDWSKEERNYVVSRVVSTVIQLVIFFGIVTLYQKKNYVVIGLYLGWRFVGVLDRFVKVFDKYVTHKVGIE